jgi:hypothetical protein
MLYGALDISQYPGAISNFDPSAIVAIPWQLVAGALVYGCHMLREHRQSFG